MNNHRSQYFYTPVIDFLRKLSPERQALLTVAKIALVLMLLSFQLVNVIGAA